MLIAFVLDNRIADRQEAMEDRRTDRQEVQENVRFIRERAGTDATKPFLWMELSGANLAGVDLGCDLSGDVVRPKSACAIFDYANLDGANLFYADLGNAYLYSADLYEASLEFADLGDTTLINADLDKTDMALTDLRGALMDGATLRDADLQVVNLTGTDLRQVDLTGTKFHGLCYDDTTQWPQNFDPPESDGCETWEGAQVLLTPAGRPYRPSIDIPEDTSG